MNCTTTKTDSTTTQAVNTPIPFPAGQVRRGPERLLSLPPERPWASQPPKPACHPDNVLDFPRRYRPPTPPPAAKPGVPPTLLAWLLGSLLIVAGFWGTLGWWLWRALGI